MSAGMSGTQCLSKVNTNGKDGFQDDACIVLKGRSPDIKFDPVNFVHVFKFAKRLMSLSWPFVIVFEFTVPSPYYRPYYKLNLWPLYLRK